MSSGLYSMRRVVLFLSVLGLFWWHAPAQVWGADPLRLTVLYINDPHSYYLPHKKVGEKQMVGGFARLSSAIKDAARRDKKEERETILLCAGDLLTGTPYSMVFKGAMGARLMNEMGFDAMAVGNHEFDGGEKNLVDRLKAMMKFPLLSANILDRNGKPMFQDKVVIKPPNSSTRIVIFGLTTTDTPTSTHPKNVKGLTFEDPIKVAATLVGECRDEDLVIALTHLGVEEDVKLAKQVPRIDLIVGGHSHTALEKPIKVGQTLVVQAGAYCEFLGRLDLTAENGKVVSYRDKLIPLDSSIPEDPSMASIIDEYKKQLGGLLNRVIGRTSVLLDGGRSKVRSDEQTNLGRLMTHLMGAKFKADAALQNGGGIRQSIHPGEISLADIYSVLPFGNHPVEISLKGRYLREALQSSADMAIGSGGKLQTWGVDFDIKDGRVNVRKVAGKAFDPDRTYTVVINDFLLAGGDGYTVFMDKGKSLGRSSYTLADILIEFLEQNKGLTKTALARYLANNGK